MPALEENVTGRRTSSYISFNLQYMSIFCRDYFNRISSLHLLHININIYKHVQKNTNTKNIRIKILILFQIQYTTPFTDMNSELKNSVHSIFEQYIFFSSNSIIWKRGGSACFRMKRAVSGGGEVAGRRAAGGGQRAVALPLAQPDQYNVSYQNICSQDHGILIFFGMTFSIKNKGKMIQNE